MANRSVILDIETDATDDYHPNVIWCVVCKDIETNELSVFRRPDLDSLPLADYLRDCNVVIGHNVINFDWLHLTRLCRDLQVGLHGIRLVDTLVVSRVLDFGLDGGHSLRAWGERLGCKKTEFNDFSHLSEKMVEYCIQDVEVTLLLYQRFRPYIESRRWGPAFDLEHFIATELLIVKQNGFHFDVDKARNLRYTISVEVEKFDKELTTAFPPKVHYLRTVEPRITKFGTLNRNDFRWAGPDLSEFNGGPFSLFEYVEFNPGSPVQIVERLNEAGWKPKEKTKGHIQTLRDKKKLKKGSEAYKKNEEKLAKFALTGWKVSEVNLDTLPETAPAAAKILAKRIKYASRVRVLTEWIDNVKEDNRIHGTINGIGAWTVRCSHDKPNTGNIPRDDAEFGPEMRSMWGVDTGFLVGVDAEGIQLRVLAHYINDERFTSSVVSGKKEDGTDPHSLNKEALGPPCKSRNDAKTFIYAWLLGAGIEKVAEILGCSFEEARQANDNFITFYPGLAHVKRAIIPRDAARGYFEGFDGRYIKIFGDDEDSRRHFALAGYLQGGEAIVMKTAMKIWIPKLRQKKIPFKLVNFVHDEWQTQVPFCGKIIERPVTFETKHLKSLQGTFYDFDIVEQGEQLTHVIQRVPELALHVAEIKADSIREAGEAFGLRCPMAGSILSGHGPIAIEKNWYGTH